MTRAQVAAACAALALGCVPAGDPPPAAGGEDSFAAAGVTVRVPVAGGEAVARARGLTLGSDGGLLLEGDASVALDAGLALEARAERIALSPGAGAARLEGRVRARLDPARGRAPREDAGAER